MVCDTQYGHPGDFACHGFGYTGRDMVWEVTGFIKLMLLLTEQKVFWNEWGRQDAMAAAFQTVDQCWPLNPASDSADERT